jgi:glycosyltransferase involved in cell wall biosynthesis
MSALVIIHQSTELYGSDYTIYQLIKYVAFHKPDLKVILIVPDDGPLIGLVEEFCEIIISDVVKVERSNFKVGYLIKLPYLLINRYWFLKKIQNKFGGKLVIYNNTMAVLASFLYGVFNKNVIGHVHEIIEKPKFMSVLLCKIFAIFNNSLIFNSFATQKWFEANSSKRKFSSKVIYNGIDTNINVSKRRKFGADLNIALVGRVNSWKGHSLLLHSFSKVIESHKELNLHFYGDVYQGMQFYREDLEKLVDKLNIKEKVTFHGFVEDQSFWDNIDILVIPSTEPEPFGMVAIQAMVRKIPVIASNHGGPSEILKDGAGLLFTPGDVRDLTDVLMKIVSSDSHREKFADAGFQRALEHFDENIYGRKILDIIEEKIDEQE